MQPFTFNFLTWYKYLMVLIRMYTVCRSVHRNSSRHVSEGNTFCPLARFSCSVLTASVILCAHGANWSRKLVFIREERQCQCVKGQFNPIVVTCHV